ncbi:hypothetical protein GEMRC1_014070 [Eukaryota sp. GEM-RC1]
MAASGAGAGLEDIERREKLCVGSSLYNVFLNMDSDSDSSVPESPPEGPLPELLPETSLSPRQPKKSHKKPRVSWHDSIFLIGVDGDIAVRNLYDVDDVDDDLSFLNSSCSMDDLKLIQSIQLMQYAPPSNVSIPSTFTSSIPIKSSTPPPKYKVLSDITVSPADSDLSMLYEGASPSTSPFSISPNSSSLSNKPSHLPLSLQPPSNPPVSSGKS